MQLLLISTYHKINIFSFDHLFRIYKLDSFCFRSISHRLMYREGLSFFTWRRFRFVLYCFCLSMIHTIDLRVLRLLFWSQRLKISTENFQFLHISVKFIRAWSLDIPTCASARSLLAFQRAAQNDEFVLLIADKHDAFIGVIYFFFHFM